MAGEIGKVIYAGRSLIDLTEDTITEDSLLAGRTAHAKSGKKITGTMANNGAMNKALDGMTTTSVTIPSGYSTGGKVTLTDSIEKALADI